MRPRGFYWVRTTPDSKWLPAMWMEEFGWSLIGVDNRDHDEGIWDDYMTEIGREVLMPSVYEAFNNQWWDH